MNKRKSLISVLVALAILLTCFINTYAVDSGKLVIELKVGSSVGKINGTTSKLEKPYLSNKTIMVPLEWLTTSIGAEVNKKANKVIEIIYCDLNAQIITGSTSYIANTEPKKLTVAPIKKNNSTMVPLEFISKNFPVSVSSDIKKGSIKIVLEDDGALNDLSFLTGGITSPKIGNSYYGWSISIPSGSRIISNSFKSDRIGITNESRSLYFEICVEDKNGRTLSELYNEVLYISSIRESKLDVKATIPYFQYTRLSEYEESLRVKVFEKGEYFYYLTINSYDNSVTPEKLVSDKYYANIVNSFSLDYKGSLKGVDDISKVKQGVASFYNYVLLNSDVKYLPWSIDIPAKWNQILKSNDPLTTSLGLDSLRYMKITINKLEEDQSLDEYVKNIKNDYDKYFSSKSYSFISADYIPILDTEAQNLKFSIKQGDKEYIIDELYFIKGDFIYEISIKLPKAEYEKSKVQFMKAINKMTFYNINESKFQGDFEKYKNKDLRVRISQQDEAIDYSNKTYNWNVKIPGNWTKSSSEKDNATTLESPNKNSFIMISALENSSIAKTLTDEEKFGILQILKNKYEVTPTQSVTNEKGYEMRTYKYRVENEESDLFANITGYCFESGKYSYCYLSVVPDLTATEGTTKELDDIWESFKITQQ